MTQRTYRSIFISDVHLGTRDSKAVATPADPALDAIEARLDMAESKIDSLLGK